MKVQFLKFLAAGGFAALVNMGSRYVLNGFMRFEVAVVVAYLAGFITAYVLSRLFVFDPSGRSRRSEVRRFAIVNVFSLGVVWVVSVGLARVVFPAVGFTWHADDIAHVVGVLAPAVTSYFGHRFYTFARVDS
jgi:putative flippase GtrA